MIDDVVTYILSKINVEYIIKHINREERPELPEAVRSRSKSRQNRRRHQVGTKLQPSINA